MSAPALAPKSPSATGSALEALLMSTIRSKRVHVPPLAPAALRVQALVTSGEYTVDSLAKVIQFDHILTAEMMRRANGANVSRGKTVESVEEAVRRLGAEETVNVAISASLGSIAVGAGPLQELRIAQWRGSALASMIAQVLAPRRRIDPGSAFLCGLFRDFPEIIAVGHVEEVMRRNRNVVGKLLPEEWYAMIRRHRDSICELVLESWNLPPAVASIIRNYKNLTNVPPEFAELAKTVGIAHIVCLLLERETVIDAERLSQVPGMKPEDAVLLASKIGHILESVEAMQSTDTSPKDAAPSKVERPASRLGPSLSPFHGTLIATGKTEAGSTFEGVAIGFEGVQVIGPVEPKLNVLKKFRVQTAKDSLEAFFNVALVSPLEEGVYRVELTPFGLGGDDKKAWERMVAAARSAPRV